MDHSTTETLDSTNHHLLQCFINRDKYVNAYRYYCAATSTTLQSSNLLSPFHPSLTPCDSHHCTSECHFFIFQHNMYICRDSSNIHFCGQQICDRKQISTECETCTLTANRFDREFEVTELHDTADRGRPDYEPKIKQPKTKKKKKSSTSTSTILTTTSDIKSSKRHHRQLNNLSIKITTRKERLAHSNRMKSECHLDNLGKRILRELITPEMKQIEPQLSVIALQLSLKIWHWFSQKQLQPFISNINTYTFDCHVIVIVYHMQRGKAPYIPKYAWLTDILRNTIDFCTTVNIKQRRYTSAMKIFNQCLQAYSRCV